MGLFSWLRRRKLGNFAAAKQEAREAARKQGGVRALRPQQIRVEIEFELEPPRSNSEQPKVYCYPYGNGVRHEVLDPNIAKLARAALKTMQQEAIRLLKR